MRKKIETDFKKRKEKLRLFGVGELSAVSGPTVNLNSNRSATVDGCKGVIDCYDSRISLRIQNGTIVFSGHGLEIVSLTENTAEISGEIDSVEFSVTGIANHN